MACGRLLRRSTGAFRNLVRWADTTERAKTSSRRLPGMPDGARVPTAPRRISRWGVVVLLPCVLAGCVEYYFMGETYHSEADVFAAQADLYNRAIARIPRRNAPVAARGRLAVPRRETVLEIGTVGPTPALRNTMTEV